MSNFEVNTIICGEAGKVLKEMPAESINCCISSPPYWSLRDYGIAGQLGLEPTFEEYIDKLCNIYDEVWRVLRSDGTCWVNMGDSYSGSQQGYGTKVMTPKQASNKGTVALTKKKSNLANIENVPSKSLCCIPDRFRIEMVNRGWIIRNKIIWYKPNPMPSSARDRFTVDFEDVIFMTKSNTPTYWIHPTDGLLSSTKPKPDYLWTYYTGIEIRTEPYTTYWTRHIWKRRNLWEGQDYWFEPQYENYQYDGRHDTILKPTDKYPGGRTPQKMEREPMERWPNPLGRNKRTVWTIPTQSFSEAHFATFPEKLVEPMILSGCPEFVCKKCGMGRRKVYEKTKPPKEVFARTTNADDKNVNVGFNTDREHHGSGQKYQNWLNEHPPTFKGYTDCGCNAGWRPGIVLDLFRRQLHHRKGSCKIAA